MASQDLERSQLDLKKEFDHLNEAAGAALDWAQQLDRQSGNTDTVGQVRLNIDQIEASLRSAIWCHAQTLGLVAQVTAYATGSIKKTKEPRG